MPTTCTATRNWPETPSTSLRCATQNRPDKRQANKMTYKTVFDVLWQKRGKSLTRSSGWGTWIRTKIDGVRVRCSTVELSPNGRLNARRPARAWRVNSEAGRGAQAPRSGVRAFPSPPAIPRASRRCGARPCASDLLDRHHPGRGLERAGDRRAYRIAAGQADFDLALLWP